MSYVASLMAAVQDRRRPTPLQPVSASYADTVTDIANLVAYWRLGSAATIIDDAGALDGTYSSAPTLVAGLPANGDQAVDFAGVTGTVPHNAALELSAFTLSFWFSPNSIPGAGGNALPIIAKNIGALDGDFVAYLPTGTNGLLRVRFHNGTANVDLDTDPILVPGGVYHVCIRADATGFDLHVNAIKRGAKQTTHTSAWSLNDGDLLFMHDPNFLSDGDGVLDEIALYSRALTTAEMVQLAQYDTAPVTNDIIFQLCPEGQVTTFDVVHNDVYVGAQTELTLEIVDDTSLVANGHSVTIDGNRDAVVTADLVDADEPNTFTYKITDIVGTSNVSTVHITVTDFGGTPPDDDYAAVVTGLAGGGPVAYWRLGDTAAATLADATVNNYDGSYPVAPLAFGAPSLTWQGSDGRAVNFGGNGYGQVAHNAAFATARGTLCGYFTANTLTAGRVFVNKGTGFVLQALANGTLQLIMGGATLSSAAGVIEAGVEYHIAVMWDQVAVWLVLDGRVLVWSRAHTTGLTGNAAAWQFARSTGGANQNIQADEIAFFDRRLSWAELDEVSEFIRGLPYDPTPETSEIVDTVGELDAALDTGGAAAGHHILVGPGTYTNLNVTIPAARSGLKRRPIVVRPQNGVGTATLANPTITFNGPRWIVFDGFNMTSPTFNFGDDTTRYIRCTRNTVDTVNGDVFNAQGMFCRFDHNDMSDMQTTAQTHFFKIVPAVGSARCHYNLADHNYLHDTISIGNNAHEVFTLGTATPHHNVFVAFTLYRNLLDNTGAEGEIISTKSKGNIYIGNTNIDQLQRPYPTYIGRHGPQTWIESEWMEDLGTNTAQVNAGSGARIIGGDNVVIGCHVLRAAIRLWMGDVTEAAYAAGADTNDPAIAGGYPACHNCLIIGCTRAADGKSWIIIGHSAQLANTVDVTDTEIDETPDIIHNAANTNGITTSPTARIPFTPAVRLTTANVGPAAADPLVPTGQS